MAQKIIYILFSVPALVIFIAAGILNLKGKCSARIRRSMTVMLIVLALSMLSYAQFFNAGLASRYSWGFDFVYCLLTPFCAPLYYLFVNCLTDLKRRPAMNVLAFLPAVIYGVLLISAELLMNNAERHAYMCNEILGQNIQMEPSVAYTWMVMVGKRIFGVFMPLQGILVMIYGEFRLNTYLRLLENYNSTYQSGKTTRIRGIHTLTVLIVVTGLVMSAIPVYESVDQVFLVSVAVASECILVTLIVSYVMELEYSAEELHGMIEDPAPAQVTVHTQSPARPKVEQPIVADNGFVPEIKRNPEQVQPLIVRIDEAMERDNLFLNPDLSIVLLSEKVGTNRTYVSKAIKDTKGCNFSDYVNRFRLDYAVELMKNTPKENIVVQNIALQCGCGSIQTFYRYFKLFFNETPTQWIERNK